MALLIKAFEGDVEYALAEVPPDMLPDMTVGVRDPDGSTIHTTETVLPGYSSSLKPLVEPDFDGVVGETRISYDLRPGLGLIGSVNILGATLGNSLLSGLNGGVAIDGVTPAADMSIMLLNQTTKSENGPWVMAGGAWTRPTWFSNSPDFLRTVYPGMLIRVTSGDVWKRTIWSPDVPESGAIVGTNDLDFFRVDGRTIVFSLPGTAAIVMNNAPYKHASPKCALIYYGIQAGGIGLTLPTLDARWLGSEVIVKDRANQAATRNLTLNAATGNQIDGGVSTVINTNRGFKRLIGGPATAAGGPAEWSLC